MSYLASWVLAVAIVFAAALLLTLAMAVLGVLVLVLEGAVRGARSQTAPWLRRAHMGRYIGGRSASTGGSERTHTFLH